MYAPIKLSIKAWAEDDRPREKLALKGKNSLSDAELLAIILGSGNRNESAVDLSKRILSENGSSLDKLSKLTVGDLKNFKGIGEAKAISIIAALELGRRRNAVSGNNEIQKIRSSNDAYQIARVELDDLQHEEFWMMMLNRSHVVFKKEQISKGGMNSTIVDPKMVFKYAISAGANGIVLCHNHPSGTAQPSDQDIRLTKRLKQGAEIFDIALIDHIIVGANTYFSFADEGII